MSRPTERQASNEPKRRGGVSRQFGHVSIVYPDSDMSAPAVKLATPESLIGLEASKNFRKTLTVGQQMRTQLKFEVLVL